MAAITQYVAFKATPRIEELCPRCFKPSLKLFHFQRMDLDGITIIGERVQCRDESIWITPLKEYAKHDATGHETR